MIRNSTARSGVRQTMAIASASALGIGALVLAGAGPASAATQTVDVTCAGSGALTLSPSSLSVAVDDIIDVKNDSGVAIIGQGASVGGTDLSPPVLDGETGSIRVSATGYVTIVGASVCTAGSLLSWTVAAEAPAPAPAANPAPVMQQFGKPASGTCDAAAPASLNWGNVASGGWGESWAEWMNDGKGGAVCSRTLVYSNSLGGWMVQA